MRHTGETAKLVFQPVDAARSGMTQGFERNDLGAGLILNLVDHAHAARTQTSEHREALGAGKIIVGDHQWRRELNRSFQKRARALVGVQQALQFGAKRGVVRTRLFQITLARERILPQRFVEHRPQPLVPPGALTRSRGSWAGGTLGSRPAAPVTAHLMGSPHVLSRFFRFRYRPRMSFGGWQDSRRRRAWPLGPCGRRHNSSPRVPDPANHR